MNRATGEASARATERLLLANKPAPEACHCDQSLELQRRVAELEEENARLRSRLAVSMLESWDE